MMDASNTLLKRLCSHITGINDDRLASHFHMAVSLLDEGQSNIMLKDHNVVADRIKRRLVREKRIDDAAHFSSLMNRLLKSAVLHNKTGILTFFLSLSQENSGPNSDSNLITSHNTFENGLCNGHGTVEAFPLPKLHHHQPQPDRKDHHEATAHGLPHPKPQSPASREPRSPQTPGSSRVSRLAALYKVSGAVGVVNEVRQPESQPLRSPSMEQLPHRPATPKAGKKKEALITVTGKMLIRDVLFIFQGIEGKIIKMDSSKDGFRLDPKVRLSPGQKEIILKLADVGWLYSQVKDFCEWGGSISGNETTVDRTAAGLVNQSLVLALKEELSDYCRLIALLEAQIQDGGDTPLGEASSGLTLWRLVMWTLEPRAQLQALTFLTHAARKLYGGACISSIYQHLHHGNPGHRAVVCKVLTRACTPIYVMLTQWLLDGALEDPHHEFFIAADSTVSDDRLWQDKYSIRWSMLPSFISKSQAQSVLASGKSLNFLRNVCHFRAPIAGREAIKAALQQTTVESLFTQDENSQLKNLIGLTFRETSCHVLEEIMTQHKLMDHLRALRRYLLLGQGDFIHCLLEILSPELDKPATNLYPHNLSSLLETAVAASNAQYEDPDILKRLDVRLLELSPGDVGWDVFTLDYHVIGPIGTVLTTECMRQYLMLFNALWKDKRMEMILSDIWKEQAATSKLCRELPELGVVLHGVQLLTHEMVHLVHQMEYYMTFEVLECGWHDLMTQLKTAQSLDEVIAAHNSFLKKIVAGTLLDAKSKEVRTHLRTFYNLIENLRAFQKRLSLIVSAEVKARKDAVLEIKARTDAGEFGTSTEHQEVERKRRREFTSKVVPKLKSDLRINTQTYQDMVQSFLLMLVQHDDQNLHLLSTRLDFNGYCHRRDHRLNQRLTFHHKRKSMGTSFCQ